MENEAAMRAKIAALKGQIEERKQTFAHPHLPLPQALQHFQAAQGTNRWAPYTRGGRGGYVKTHKNRSLVIAGASNRAVPDGGNAAGTLPPFALSAENNTMISTRGAKVNQVMTKHTFEREKKQRQELQNMQSTVERQKSRRGHNAHVLVANTATQRRELEIEGIRFQLKDDGSKLVRLPGQSSLTQEAISRLNHIDAGNSGKETPKQAMIADVEFLRTKHGNLIRVTAAANGGHRYCPKRKLPTCAQNSPFHSSLQTHEARLQGAM